MAPPVSPARDPAAPPVSPPRNSAAPSVSLPRVRRHLMCPLIGIRRLLQLQLLYVELRSSSFTDWFIFTRLHVQVFIATTVAAGLARPVNPLHRLPFHFHLQARLAGSPLTRRRDSHCLNHFLRYLFARVFERAVYLHYIACFHRHRQRRTLTRAPPHICAGPPLARRPSPQPFLLPAPVSLLNSSSVLHLRKAPSAPLPLFSLHQLFLLPTPATPLDSGSVSHLFRKTIPCGGRT